ncbi:hypothetical protein [Marispirochaeta sp.]|uniref:hypothetical protein n=1 Tax=Marispirochaeta sp. TaxID=2038653 RepID=UPI0029C96BC3|nr:hypothetical protein [Marispirochaeta sp.]
MKNTIIILCTVVFIVSCSISVEVLNSAIKDGDIEQVRQILDRDPILVQKFDSYKNNPISIAIENENIKMVDLFLDYGANPNSEIFYKEKMSLLYYSILMEESNLALKLLHLGSSIDYVTDSDGFPLLHLAAVKASDKVFDEIISREPDLSVKIAEDEYAFYSAIVAHKPMRAIKLCSPELLNSVNKSKLWFEIVSNWEDGSEELGNEIKNEIGLLLFEDALLFEGIYWGNYEAVEWLIDNGLNPNKRINAVQIGYLGDTPIDEAKIRRGRLISYSGGDTKLSTDDPEVKSYDRIIELLENTSN